MVNWVEVQKQLLRWLAKIAGLRQQAVYVDDAGTVINFWAPKEKLPPWKKSIAEQVESDDKQRRRSRTKCSRPSVVLVHGFAGDGLTTWEFQVNALAKHYDVYIPDLLFFGDSTSPLPDRSTRFMAECLATALRKLGVEHCTVVGFSYGGFLAFKMAEVHPALVRSVVVSGAGVVMTDAMDDTLLGKFGARVTELLLPHTVERLRSLFSAAMYKKQLLPGRLLKDLFKVMYDNRKERAELLESLVIRNKDASVPVFQQNILLLWGENDRYFPIEFAMALRDELGEKATLRSISKAGHLVQMERPCVYNRCIMEFLAHVNTN